MLPRVRATEAETHLRVGDRTLVAISDGMFTMPPDFLGEQALVDSSSREADTEIVYQNTLFDENAASHIASGAGFTWTVDHLDDGVPTRALVNESRVHTDFMVGGPDVEIDAVEPGGTVVPLLHGGEWQI